MRDEFLKYGFYVKGIVPVATERQVQNPDYVRALKNYAASLGISWRRWHQFLTDIYRDMPVIFVNDQNDEVFLDMEVFETASIDYWFRDFVKPVLPCTTPIVRKEAKARVVVFASLMCAYRRTQADHS